MADRFIVRVNQKLIPTRAGPPKGSEYYRQTVEITGKGDQLCYDAFGGRLFRSSLSAVQEAAEFYIRDYMDGNWLNYNDLYALIGIEQTDFGAAWGYSPSEDYKVDLEFYVEYFTLDEIKNSPTLKSLAKYGESIVVVEPHPNCLPYESYMEV